jgi:hypothetical protein
MGHQIFGGFVIACLTCNQSRIVDAKVQRRDLNVAAFLVDVLDAAFVLAEQKIKVQFVARVDVPDNGPADFADGVRFGIHVEKLTVFEIALCFHRDDNLQIIVVHHARCNYLKVKYIVLIMPAMFDVGVAQRIKSVFG